jgi:uncharacterized membrane protein YdjX (TVP38/TMEM64 family)
MTEVPNSLSVNSGLRRWGPLALLMALAGLFFASGFHRYLSFQSIAENHVLLKDYVASHLATSMFIYALIYICVVALSVPGAGVLSIVGGFLFGWLLSGTVTIIAATIGAAIVFQIVKTSLGAAIANRAGPFVTKLSHGFERNAFNYVLFLRLVPAVPFFAVNAVAGLARIKFSSFVLATVIGIVPGSYVFAWLGRGLESILQQAKQAHDLCIASTATNCTFAVTPQSLITREIIIAFAALAVLSLTPIVIKKVRSSK